MYGRGQHKHAIKQYTKPKKSYTLFSLGIVETIPRPPLGFLREFFLANHTASTDNLTRTTNRQNRHGNDTQKVAPINGTKEHTHKKKPMLRQTDRAWFSHLLRHLATKWSGSILTTPDGNCLFVCLLGV